MAERYATPRTVDVTDAFGTVRGEVLVLNSKQVLIRKPSGAHQSWRRSNVVRIATVRA